MAKPAQVLAPECTRFRSARFGKQPNVALVIDDKLVDNRPMRSDHLREGALDALRKKCRELEEENARLRNLLAEHRVAPTLSPAMPSVEPAPVKSSLSTQEKITLFRSLFRGREDVYAQRWESQGGRIGYSPRTERDWQAYSAAKPADRKRVDKETRGNIPLSDEALHSHLVGKQTLGIYPLLLDETCWFLAADFDKKT